MPARFFDCTCGLPSVRTFACNVCSRHLCRVHSSPELHTCGQDEDDDMWKSRVNDELTRLRALINDDAVCKLASSLKGGLPCTIEHFDLNSKADFMGNANYHAQIHFEGDSSIWLMRVPRVTNANRLPPAQVEYFIRSEYATLKFLESTRVPAPPAYAYGIAGEGTDHGVGVSFILMGKLPGRTWNGQGRRGGAATKEEKTVVWKGLADILIEIERHPFKKAGSLCYGTTGIEVSKIASDRFQAIDIFGPFSSSAEYLTALTEQYLELITDGQLYSSFPVDAYLIYMFLQKHVGLIAPLPSETEPERFYLKHVDDTGGHIMVDEDLNVVGIIDWQMTRIVPRSEAFGPSLVTADMKEIWFGSGCVLSDDDLALATLLEQKGMHDAKELASDGRLRRFCWGLGCETELRDALPMARAILKAFGVEEKWEVWREKALEEYGEEVGLKSILLWASKS